MDVKSDYSFTLADNAHLFDTEDVATPTSFEQLNVEQSISHLNAILDNEYGATSGSGGSTEKYVLCRQSHIHYVLRSLRTLSSGYMSMDSSRTWFAFWGLHSLRLLNHRPDKELLRKIVTFLNCCHTPTGGYAGAPGQYAHLATTYAAVMALVSVGTIDALASIDRVKLYDFLIAMKRPNGSFCLHEGGEADIRGTYCAVACAFITNIADDDLFADTAAWIMRCQTYEGGFSGEPNCETHGGYTYCALASLALLGKLHLVNANKVTDWLVKRQMKFEGGFNGRSNKLVDGCYSFWQAAAFFPLEFQLNTNEYNVRGLFNEEALQQYILVACQDRVNGGLRDKPDKHPDLYHTCYTLAGLSIAQSYAESADACVGGKENRLATVHSLYNVCLDLEKFATQYFRNRLPD